MGMSKETKKNSRLSDMLANVFKFRFWLDTERTQGFLVYIVDMFKKLFYLQPQQSEESFLDVKERLKLDDAALLKQQKKLLSLSLFMLFLAVLILGYIFYQALYGSFVGAVLSVVVMFIALALAFRYHFWYFQLKRKKLGCSFKEWLSVGLLGGKTS
jgi:intracellular multiplication protein IcmV